MTYITRKKKTAQASLKKKIIGVNVSLQHMGYEGCHSGASRIIFDCLGFFVLHLNLSAQAFLAFLPLSKAAVVAENKPAMSCSGAQAFLSIVLLFADQPLTTSLMPTKCLW